MIRHTPTAPQAQPQSSARSSFLYRFEAKLEVQPLGIVPEGLRMANAFEGRVTEGIMKGGRVWGIDDLLLRFDGVAIIDAQKTISSGDIHVHEHVRGYGLPPEDMQMPPLEVLLDPSFEWPDVLFPLTGSSTFRASDPGLLWLNQAVANIEGWFSFATGGLAVETTLVKRTGEVAGPPRPSELVAAG